MIFALSKNRLELPSTPGEQTLLASMVAAVVSVLGHSAFHNSSPLVGEMRGFIILAMGTSVAITMGERTAARTREIYNPAEELPAEEPIDDDEPPAWHPIPVRPRPH